MQERTALEDQLTSIGRIERDLDDQLTMIELGEAEKDQKVIAEAEEALRKLKADVARREMEALLSGEADPNDSYLEVHAGAGVHFEVAVVRIGFAREQRLHLAPRHVGLELAQGFLGLGDDFLILLGLAQLDHGELVVEIPLDSADRGELILERRALLH